MRAALWTVVPRLADAELDALIENLTALKEGWRRAHPDTAMPGGLAAVRTVSACLGAVEDTALAADVAELVMAAVELVAADGAMPLVAGGTRVSLDALDDFVAVLADERGRRL